MTEALLLPFQFPFMQNAFAVAALISVPTALLSCFLVLRGWSLMGDATSHAVLPGIVIAYVVGIPLIVGAFAAGMVCALLTGFLQSNSRVKQDTVMGVCSLACSASESSSSRRSPPTSISITCCSGTCWGSAATTF